MALKYGARKGASKEINRDIVQKGTVKDLEDMLNSHQIALMVRPTGFGKTHLMLELCKKEKYSKILYIYPTTVIMQSVFESYHRCDESGRIIPPGTREGIKFAANPEEHSKYPELPYLEFRSYLKMLVDWNHAYKHILDRPWESLSESSKDEVEAIWNKKDDKEKLKIRKKWLAKTLSDVELLILDEAHTAGAEGFLSYWPYIKELTVKGSKKKRLHVVGATATPLRTDPKIDIEKEVFSYERAGKRYSARIPDFTFIDCWKCGLMPYPYYTKGVIDFEYQLQVLEKTLYNNLIGDNSLAGKTRIPARDRGRKSKSGDVKVVDNVYLDRKRQTYQAELDKLRHAFSQLKQPEEIISSAVNAVASAKVENGDYLRFLVFYQSSEDLVKYHKLINSAVEKAFNVGEGNIYHKMNDSYIATNKDKLGKYGVVTSEVSTIAERDKEIRRDIEAGKGHIDLIHSIDVLNMGYHVGNVTGVIVKRSTSSEIKYYQQIGRCMSVVEDGRPLIIDFANADAELFISSHDTLRDEAGERIKEFIGSCIQSEECSKLNMIYSSVNLYMSADKVDDSLLEYWYFDRNAPIYFIKGIAESLGCYESLDSIVKRIRLMSINKYGKQQVTLDDYLISEERVSKRLKGTKDRPGVILRQSMIVNEIESEGN